MSDYIPQTELEKIDINKIRVANIKISARFFVISFFLLFKN